MSDIGSFYGGSLLVMCGKDSVIIAGDKRHGMRFITTNTERTSIYKINNKCFVGLTGFLPDCQFLIEHLKKHIQLFEITENKEIDAEELAYLLKFILYSFRKKSPLYLTPVVAGIKDGKPVCISMDCLGCISDPKTFVAAGTAEDNLNGICEALFVADFDEDQLFTNAMQAFLNATDRDAFSGWGAECYIITEKKCRKRVLKGRVD
ncbi:hypothetical protein NUSPORA_00415 [Nucleospora cyclopteri]